MLGCVPLFVRNGGHRDGTKLGCERSWYGVDGGFPPCMHEILPFWDHIPYKKITYATTLEQLPAFLRADAPVIVPAALKLDRQGSEMSEDNGDDLPLAPGPSKWRGNKEQERMQLD